MFDFALEPFRTANFAGSNCVYFQKMELFTSDIDHGRLMSDARDRISTSSV